MASEHGAAHAASSRRAILGCAFNLMNGTLGPGMLVLPLVFARCGLLVGGLLLLLVWLFSYLALLLLLECCSRVRSSSLVHLARAYGPNMSTAVDVSVLLYFYGSCISYLILMGGTFSTLVHGPADLAGARHTMAAGGSSWSESAATHLDKVLLIGFTMVLLLPLACSHSLDRLSAASSLILLLYAFITIVVWTCAVREAPEHHHAEHHHAAAEHHHGPPAETTTLLGRMSHVLLPVVQALPTMAYCFSSQAVYPPALEAVQHLHGGYNARSISRLLTDFTFSITLLGYLGVGVGGAVAVHGLPPANVLDAYAPGWALLGAQLSLITALGLSYPLMFIVARTHALSLAEGWLARRGSSGSAVIQRLTLVGVVLSVVVSIAFPRVEAVLGLIGGTCSVSLSFVIPALLYRRLVGMPGGQCYAYVVVDSAEHRGADGSSEELDLSTEEELEPVRDDVPNEDARQSAPKLSAGFASDGRKSAGHRKRAAGDRQGSLFRSPVLARAAVYGSIVFGVSLAAISLPLQLSELRHRAFSSKLDTQTYLADIFLAAN